MFRPVVNPDSRPGMTGAAALVVLLSLSTAAHAREPEAGWRLMPELHLTGITNLVSSDGATDTYDTVAVTGELTFVSDVRPYWGGPFLDYRVSSTGRHDRNLNAGVYGRYNWSRWDATGWLFVNRARDDTSTWFYATRLRFRVADGHKLGIESLAPIERADRARLMFGYYRSLHESWTMNVLAGRTIGGHADVAARFEVAWHWH